MREIRVKQEREKKPAPKKNTKQIILLLLVSLLVMFLLYASTSLIYKLSRGESWDPFAFLKKSTTEKQLPTVPTVPVQVLTSLADTTTARGGTLPLVTTTGDATLPLVTTTGDATLPLVTSTTASSTEALSTEADTTEAGTTEADTTQATTEATTEASTETDTAEATTEAKTTEAATTKAAATTEAPETTKAATTEAATTKAPETTEAAPSTKATETTEDTTTEAATTKASTTTAPTTKAPTTEVPTTEPPLDFTLLATHLQQMGISEERLSGTQLVVLQGGTEGRGLLYFFEKTDAGWTISNALAISPATLGSHGIVDQKPAGAAGTPAGYYSLGPVLGQGETALTDMPYHPIKAGDRWITDPASAFYNQLVNANQKEKDWKSSLDLSQDQSFRYAILIGFNSRNVDPKQGRAVFLNVESDAHGDGDVGTLESTLFALLQWLKPEADPHILIYSYETNTQ